MERLDRKEPRRKALPLTLKPSILMDLRFRGMDTGSPGPPACGVWELSVSVVQRALASSSWCSPHILLMLLLFPGELPHTPHIKPRAVCSPQLSPIDRRVASPRGFPGCHNHCVNVFKRLIFLHVCSLGKQRDIFLALELVGCSQMTLLDRCNSVSVGTQKCPLYCAKPLISSIASNGWFHF